MERDYRQYTTTAVDPSGLSSITHWYPDDITEARLKADLLTLPFFSLRRVFVCHRFLSSAPKPLVEALADLLPLLPDSTEVVLYEPESFDKRLRATKSLLDSMTIRYYPPARPSELTALVRAIAKEAGVTLPPDTVNWLAVEHGADTMRLAQEATKLAFWSRANDRPCDLATVQTLSFSSTTTTTFALADAVIAGDIRRAIITYRQLQGEGQAPLMLLALLASQWRSLAILALARRQNTPPSQLATATGLKPFVIQKLTATVDRLPIARLVRGYQAIVRTDGRIKSGDLEDGVALPLLVVSLCATVKK